MLSFILLAAAFAAFGVNAQLPAEPEGVKTIKSPGGYTIRYKEPGKDGVCETTPGVNSYSGYIDSGPDSHTFFWFFEARNNKSKNAPTTLWLNGGPGSDSMISLFQGTGPCNITADFKTELNPNSWTEYSNMLFLAQPVGVGYSYSTTVEGTFNSNTGDTYNASVNGVTGRFPDFDATKIDTTDEAAIATWNILQAFYDALPQLDSGVKSKEFNLWTESYGGHYGPAFYKYFYDQNNLIASGAQKGVKLEMQTLGIASALVDEAIQAPFYPEFATKNTYGIKMYNDTVYNVAKFNLNMNNGCLSQLNNCKNTARQTLSERAICTEAAAMCRDGVEGMYKSGDRGTYDIRLARGVPEFPDRITPFLNSARIQNILGTNLNYTFFSNLKVYYAFQQTGDFVYPDYLDDLAYLLSKGVRVHMYNGDADYICNWFGAEAVSLRVDYPDAANFRAAGYEPFTVKGKEYGVVRQYGLFSYLRMYDSGHLIPYHQPKPALEMFKRALGDKDIAHGTDRISNTYKTNGTAKSTHTNAFVPLPGATKASKMRVRRYS
ncbi:MAG: hypothetical protein M1814_001255 [Vezdaea aestivalis]|nr:MAG: hypothetical protein M1814_001255 [Vezdaea aestivalis]